MGGYISSSLALQAVIFYRLDVLPAAQPTASKALKA